MEVSPTLAAAAVQPATNQTPAAITSDFETFLRMLTVQMQNQDPLNPVDSSDYAVQLATFSGVEQQVLTNDLLRGLAAQNGTSSLAQLANWVGMEARAVVPARFDGSPVTVSPEPAQFATSAQLVVKDANENIVQRLDIAVTAEDITWAGVDQTGTPFPPGVYSFETISYDGTNVLSEEQAAVYAQVNEVRLDDGIARLTLASGGRISADDVTALRDPNLL